MLKTPIASYTKPILFNAAKKPVLRLNADRLKYLNDPKIE